MKELLRISDLARPHGSQAARPRRPPRALAEHPGPIIGIGGSPICCRVCGLVPDAAYRFLPRGIGRDTSELRYQPGHTSDDLPLPLSATTAIGLDVVTLRPGSAPFDILRKAVTTAAERLVLSPKEKAELGELIDPSKPSRICLAMQPASRDDRDTAGYRPIRGTL
jgi:hypothetical protein